MERAKVPDSSLSLTLRKQKTVCLKPAPRPLNEIFRDNITLSDLQKLAVWLCSRVKPPLTFLAGDFIVIPRHLLMGRGGDQLLELWSLADDGLLHGLSLKTEEHTPKQSEHTLLDKYTFIIVSYYCALKILPRDAHCILQP